MKYSKIPVVVTLIVTLFCNVPAQPEKEILSVQPVPYTNYWVNGEPYILALKINLDPEWHINAHTVLDEFTIPTEVILDESDAYEVERIDYPDALLKKFGFTEDKIPVYQGEIAVFIILKNRTNNLIGNVKISGVLSYQGCNDLMCLPPDETPFNLKVDVADPGVKVEKSADPVFAGLKLNSADQNKEKSESPFAGKGILLTAVLLFLGGLGLNLTPCVYPLIPITISYFGGQAAGKGKAYLLAIFYVLGLAITYSVLGTLAAFTGGMFGTALTNPVVLIVIAIILVALSLSMFGLYEIRVPTFLLQIAGGGRSGYPGALLMGLTMGIVAAPCIGPFVIGLLAYIAATGNPAIGFAYFFTLSLGLGFPYLFLAGFSSKINSLPSSGEWMVGVRNIFGWILLGMALYFIGPLLPENVNDILFPGFIIIAALYLLIIDKNGLNSRGFVIGRNVIAAIALVIAGWLVKPEAEISLSMNWKPFSEDALQLAIENHEPVIIDFFADWCIPCKELDSRTFTHPDVVKYSENFELFKANLTSENEENNRLKEKYNIKGVPTILFYDKNGNLRNELTLYGFEKPEMFIERMNEVLKFE